ncbi:hypothetical protein EJP82_25980 [Paenibacillus anaericanus]|uniref:Primase C-terminal 1 domain-containing protein n=1 Tax=Paenibacillus anaericanus TaxID=170367 RepID=A0A3S1BFA7_9BACL|nr:primase C-terminal domain-containing protein [Paenibacillus anaericanus]RUT39483.1 hypothetical protein EJP82_25980 [Paenibacillus anaericanus]
MQLERASVNSFFETLITSEVPGFRYLCALDQNNRLVDFEVQDKDEIISFADKSRWFTPNLFNLKHCGRTKKNVQYINAFVIEFDCYLPSVLDVIDRIEESGLEPPHFLIRSKTPGHWHVYWIIDPIPAFSNVKVHTERITKYMANTMGADVQAVGVERWFAVPHSDIYKYAPSSKFYTYQYFKDWYETNFEFSTSKNQQPTRKNGKILKMDVFGHPAIKKLMQGFSVGQRDHACFTLALLFYSQDWSEEQALDELMDWNNRNTEQMSKKQIIKCLRSAYSGKYKGPKSEYVEYLTGIPFKLQIMREYKGERTYQKLYDIQYRILQLIRKEGTLKLSQSDIAKAINAPLRSVKKAIKELIELKRIRKIGGGTGPGNNASYKLANSTWKKAKNKKVVPQNQHARFIETNDEPSARESLGSVSLNGANALTSFSTGPPG